MISAEALTKSVTREEVVEVPRRGPVRVRELLPAEIRRARDAAGDDEHEFQARALSLLMVEPKIDLATADAWLETMTAEEEVFFAELLPRLCGVVPPKTTTPEDKALVKSFREG